MTVYAIPNHSYDHIDPLKQPLQSPPTYYSHHGQQQLPLDQPRHKPSVGERFRKLSSKAGHPLNKAANISGAEGWWPSSMENECVKAARILHSFTKLGEPAPPKTNGPMHPTGLTRKSIVKIPQPVLDTCAGLAIFNVLRAGACHGSIAGGSGVVIAHRPDGTWSPPSSFVITTLGGGFVLGLDVCDCVCVLNSPEQVSAFTKPRVSIGGDMSIAVGPVGTGSHVEAAVSRTARPVWSYMKSRGLWAGVQIDGTIVVSRSDANAVFYKEPGITTKKILQGDVAWPMGARPLFEVLRAVQGRREFNEEAIQDAAVNSPTDDTCLNGRCSFADVQVDKSPELGEKLLDQEKVGEAESDIYESPEEEKARLAKLKT